MAVTAAEKGTYAEEFDLAFQKHVLAVVVRVQGLALRYRTAISPDYFSADVHRMVAESFFPLLDAHGVLPSRTTLFDAIRRETKNETQQAADELLGDIFADDLTDAEMVASRLVAFGKAQAMRNAVLTAAEMIDRGEDAGIGEVIEKARLVGEDILDLGLSYDDMPAMRSTIYAESETDLIPTGLPHLDLALGGGLGRGELGVVASFPKFGKSRLLLNFGHGAILAGAGHNVLYVTFEMHRNKVIQRLDARLAGPNVRLLREDRDKYFALLAERQKQLVEGKFRVQGWATRSCSVAMLDQHITLLASQGFAVDEVLVDYADIMKAETRLETSWGASAGVYEGLRTLAGKWNAAVWTVSQVQRGQKEEEIIRSSGVKESYEKVFIADAFLTASQTQEEYVAGRFRLILDSMRNVESGSVVECVVNGEQCMVKSVALYNAGLERIDGIETHVPAGASPIAVESKMGTGTKPAAQVRIQGKSSALRSKVGTLFTAERKNAPRKIVGMRVK